MRGPLSASALDLVLATTATAAVGVFVGLSGPGARDPRFVLAMACSTGLCGLAAAVGGRFASQREGAFGAKVLVPALIVVGFALIHAVAGLGSVLAASAVLVASVVLGSTSNPAARRGGFIVVAIAALGLGLLDRHGPFGRLAPGSNSVPVEMTTALLLGMAGLCLLARFSARAAVALALISTTAAGWALAIRQGGSDALWTALLYGLLFSMAALSFVALSSQGGEGSSPGGRRREAGGLAAAAAQASTEEEVRALLSSARVLMWLSAPDGRRTYFNDSWLEFTGRTMGEELGNGWTGGMHAEDARRLVERGDGARGDLTAFETEYRLRRYDGEYRWMLERGQPRIGRGGVLLGLVGTCVDITERRLRETALQEERSQLARRVEDRTSELARANAELAKAARLKDEFLANVSHELRTPMTAILGLSEALLGEEQGPLSGRQQKALQTIEGSAQHLLSLINELLDLARIEAGQMTIEPKEGVSLDSVCQGSLRFIGQAAQKKSVRLSFVTDGSVTTLNCDERRLKQVLINLLGNAVKFTSPGGTVGLEVVGDRSEKVVRFTVWDTGIGIRKEDMTRLFQPFVQLDGSLTRQHGGTGLGLALSRRMVELHGGRVLAGSEPGKGSRFTVTLPWDGGQPIPSSLGLAAAHPVVSPALNAERTIPRERVEAYRILLVEDNPDLSMMFGDHLEGQGHHVIAAPSGADGVALAVREGPDVILMDIEMPGTDGLEAIRQIRAQPGLEATPILAITAHAMPGDRERCLGAGATDYVSKPLSLRSLSAWIDGCRGIR